MTNKTYKVIGITDDTHICEHCGKKNLKRVVVLEHVDTGAIVRYGTSCALRALAIKKEETFQEEIALRAKAERIAAMGYGLLFIRDNLSTMSKPATLVDGKIYVKGIHTPIFERKRN